MSGALDAFRSQREAVDDLRARVEEIGRMIAAVSAQVDTVARDPALRDVLNAERTWLAQTEQVLEQVRRFREDQMQRFWPAVWRRWAIAAMLSVVSAFACGAGYRWATTEEVEDLRARAQIGDLVAQRLAHMTPPERRQFDTLIRPDVLKR